MAFLGGLLGKLIGAAILIVILVLAVGVWAYATDFAVEATVKEKSCGASPATVSVQTKLFGIGHTVEVTRDECGIIQAGNFVVYHLRSQRTIIYSAEGGDCVYDTTAGLYCGTRAF